MLVVVGWNGGARLATLEVEHAEQLQRVERTRVVVDGHSKQIADLKADVRSVVEATERQELVLTRQEQSLKELDRLVVRLETIAKASR